MYTLGRLRVAKLYFMLKSHLYLQRSLGLEGTTFSLLFLKHFLGTVFTRQELGNKDKKRNTKILRFPFLFHLQICKKLLWWVTTQSPTWMGDTLSQKLFIIIRWMNKILVAWRPHNSLPVSEGVLQASWRWTLPQELQW